MAERLQTLEKLVESGKAEAFAWYALAMEYRKLGRQKDALKTFEALRDQDRNYLPLYLMAGQMLLELDRASEARPWLEQGIELARAKGDGKALGELESALGSVG
jgi:predicted Zn-dependent protease